MNALSFSYTPFSYTPLFLARMFGMAFIFVAPCAVAVAQTPAPDAFQVAAVQADIYTPDDFAQFQPNTALDMVQRVPGFRIDGGGGGARGFGQASLNIVINGRRPSSKSSDAREILSRIPAGNVKRIEIVDGASLDIPGLTGQVANIISQSGKLSGNWRYAARFVKHTEPQLREGEISLTGARGNLAFVANLRAEQFTFDERGPEQFFNGDGVLFEDRQEAPYFAFDAPFGALNLTWTPANGHIANLNMSGQKGNRRAGARETYAAITEAGRTGFETFGRNEDELEYEISGDYALPFRTGELKFIGLHRYEDSDFNNTFDEFTIGDPEFSSVFDRRAIEGEYIARTEYSFKPRPAHDLQFSLEGAFNVLDSESVLIETDAEDEFDAVRVEEKRSEANITHGWTLSDAVSFQSSLGAEYSELSVVSTDDPARKFVRPKGFVSVSYKQSPQYTWRARAQREVGQLNFGSFVSRASLGDGVDTSGNPDIVPEQNWNFEVELERHDDAALSGTVKAFARFIEDPIAQILFDNGTPADASDDSEGPGNLDSAKEYGIEGNLTWLMDGIGFGGARIEARGGLRDSDIFDPIVQINRRTNRTRLWNYRVSFRHDILQTPYAYGVYIEDERNSPFFGIVQDFETILDAPGLGVRAEHKDLFGMKWVVRVDNVLNWRVERQRRIFDGTRAGALLETQQFSRRRAPRLSLIISDTF